MEDQLLLFSPFSPRMQKCLHLVTAPLGFSTILPPHAEMPGMETPGQESGPVRPLLVTIISHSKTAGKQAFRFGHIR